jgi:hypothetical protein
MGDVVMAAAPALSLYDEGVNARKAANNEKLHALGLSNHPANTKKAPTKKAPKKPKQVTAGEEAGGAVAGARAGLRTREAPKPAQPAENPPQGKKRPRSPTAARVSAQSAVTNLIRRRLESSQGAPRSLHELGSGLSNSACLVAGVQVGSFVLFPPSWIPANTKNLKRFKDPVSGDNAVIGYVVEKGPTQRVAEGKFLVDCEGAPHVLQERTAAELEPLLAPPSESARLAELFFSPPDRSSITMGPSERDEELQVHDGSLPKSMPSTEEGSQPRLPTAHPTRQGRRKPEDPPAAPTTLSEEDLQSFNKAWEQKLKEFAMAAYAGGEIKNNTNHGPVEDHESPYCKSADTVVDIVFAKMEE